VENDAELLIFHALDYRIKQMDNQDPELIKINQQMEQKFETEIRALATYQRAYISGETLSDIEQPGECLVINKWKRVEEWNKWFHCQERAKIEGKIETLTGEKTEYHLYSPMVPGTMAEKATHKQAETIENFQRNFV
jgi:hypothetical protein